MFQDTEANKKDVLPAQSSSAQKAAAVGDTPKIATRRQREKKTISWMVAMYCAGNHGCVARAEKAYCGEAVCPECLAVDAYAVERTERCKRMDVKISCEACGNHCYQPKQREMIRQVMRWSGPRMIGKHPIAALRHMLGR